MGLRALNLRVRCPSITSSARPRAAALGMYEGLSLRPMRWRSFLGTVGAVLSVDQAEHER